VTTAYSGYSPAPGGNAAAGSERYGLSMRFKVTVSDGSRIRDLGDWSSCKGLRVDFKTETIRIGGEYNGEVRLPGQATYAPVVLERAMEERSSGLLRAWLRELADTWMNHREGAEPPKGSVVISLQDAFHHVVASWTLENAYPVSWSGPVMDAKQSAVAVEALTFEHEGFLPNTAAAPSAERRPESNARLGPAGSTEGQVVFDFNPASIEVSHTAPVAPSSELQRSKVRAGAGRAAGARQKQKAAAMGGLPYDEYQKANGTTSISLRSLTFDGPGVWDTCERLRLWSYFSLGKDGKGNAVNQLPKLHFSWGRQPPLLVHLNQITISYTRFSAAGTPTRATVNLTLHALAKELTGTNPHSGGLPGRRTHVLAGAEDLPALATRTYGRPGRWRDIAAANGIADPLRVRPGTRVFLPSALEAGQ
jgi:phage tail-like protein